MENLTVLNTFNLLPSKKDEVKEFSRQLKDNLLDGMVEPLRMLSQLKCVEKTIKDVLDDKEVKDCFLNGLKGDKKIETFGCLFEEAEAGTKYDYSVSEEWLEANKLVKDAEEKRKAIETKLKTITENSPYLDSVSGELIHALPKSSTTIIKTTLK